MSKNDLILKSISDFFENENNFKEILLDEFLAPIKRAPLLVVFCLYILKFIYYRLHLISKDNYSLVKRYIQNDMMGRVSHFLLLQ